MTAYVIVDDCVPQDLYLCVRDQCSRTVASIKANSTSYVKAILHSTTSSQAPSKPNRSVLHIISSANKLRMTIIQIITRVYIYHYSSNNMIAKQIKKKKERK